MNLKNLIEDLNNKWKRTLSEKNSQPSPFRERTNKCHIQILPRKARSNLLELLHPGTFVKLKNQPNDLPPFQLIACRGGRCLVRQQTWGKYIHWEVEHHRLKSA